MDPHRLFPPSPTSAPGAAKLAYGHTITCTSCGTSDTLSAGAKSGPGGLPDDVVMNKMRQRGWAFRRRGRKRECPACCGGALKGATPEHPADAVDAAFCCVAGCDARLPVERSGRSWPIIGGEVKVPPSIARNALKRAGWFVNKAGDTVCAQHADGYCQGMYSNRSALGCEDGKRMERLVAGIVGKRLTYRRPDLGAKAFG